MKFSSINDGLCRPILYCDDGFDILMRKISSKPIRIGQKTEGRGVTRSKDLYTQAGVDVQKGDQLVDWIRENKGHSGGVVSGVGGFAALFRPDFSGISDPLLIASTDGVGTKVLLASETNQLDGLGQDLVGMCVNDLYCTGGYPLFFLDYYATAKLEEDQFKSVIGGIQKACGLLKIPLLGGETAEMPGLYAPREFDLAGFVVGVVDGSKRLDASHVKDGDLLYALPSSGFHSNGYSLLRKWVKDFRLSKDDIEYLLTPTKLYHQIPKVLNSLNQHGEVRSLAHITGGGISGNLPRVLPYGAVAEVHLSQIRVPEKMAKIFQTCGVDAAQVEGIFNIGVGMIAVIDPAIQSSFESQTGQLGLDAYIIGNVRMDEHRLNVEAEVIYV